MPSRKPQLTAEEEAFLDGPVEELCRMLDDWRIVAELHDLPPEVWQFIKEKGFFGMIIPKEYGGLGFSALAHSQVIMKIASRSVTAAVTVMVPNSLGPAELLLRYGTEAQKEYYLPRLARGEEIPCFALTGPEAGSDAASIPDTGVVCRGMFAGRGNHRHPAQLGKALHHPRPGGDGDRPRLPALRPGTSPGRRRTSRGSPWRSSPPTPRE